MRGPRNDSRSRQYLIIPAERMQSAGLFRLFPHTINLFHYETETFCASLVEIIMTIEVDAINWEEPLDSVRATLAWYNIRTTAGDRDKGCL